MASSLSSGPPPFPIARFSLEQWHRMVQSGAFAEDDRLELIEGWVVRKMAKGPAHEYATGQIEEFVRRHLPAGWHVRNQAPVTLTRSEPEPDLTIARGTRDDYRARHPGADDVAVVIEVSDTSLVTDRAKAKTYGEAGSPEYWLVDLPDRCIELHRDPSPEHDVGYATCTILTENDDLHLILGVHEHGKTKVAPLLP